MQLCRDVVVSPFLVCRRKFLSVAVLSGETVESRPVASNGAGVGLPGQETAK